MDGSLASQEHDVESTVAQASKKKDATTPKVLAFKALPTRTSIARDGQGAQTLSEKELISNVCDEIKRTALKEDSSQRNSFVEEEDIVSLQDARKGTGLVEQWSHSLKRMVWG